MSEPHVILICVVVALLLLIGVIVWARRAEREHQRKDSPWLDAAERERQGPWGDDR